MESEIEVADLMQAYGYGWQYDPQTGQWFYRYATYYPEHFSYPPKYKIVCPHCGRQIELEVRDY